MRPLPRLLAVTSDAICRAPDFAARIATLAESGPATGFLVRAPAASAEQQAGQVERVMALARPRESAVLVHARPDLARAVGAQGVQLRGSDLCAADARRVMGRGWIGVSVHDRQEAETAISEGVDFLLAGNVFETTTHPGRPARGLAWLRELCALGPPVIAIGGITPSRAPEVQRAGAWGVAAISALWESASPSSSAEQLLSPWSDAR